MIRLLRQLPLPSRLLLAGAVLIAALLVLFVWIEVSQNREDLLRYVNDEAATLIETMNRGGEITLLANTELEEALIDRLIVAARLVDHLGSHTQLSDASVDEERRRSNLGAVLVFDAAGRITAASPRMERDAAAAPAFDELIEALRGNTYTWRIDPALILPGSGDTLFLLAHRRLRGGMVAVGIESAALRALRMRLGIGRLLRDIGKNPDIAFVVLQDEDGILTASGGVRSMSAIADDTLLLHALRSDRAHTRIVDYDGRKVFEVVKAMHQENGTVLLSRIGLSLERIREVQQRSMRRVIILAGGLLVAVVLLFGFLITRRQFSALERRHRRMRSSTDSILENIADAVVAIDEHGRITACNSAARNMLALGDALCEGDDYATVFPDDALLLEHTRRHGAIEYRELQYGASENSRILAVSTSVVRTPEGAVDLLIAIARDLTEYRQALEQLQRKDKLTAMGELAGGIAHEIRNPLNAIGIIAQRFQHEFTPTADAEEFSALAQTIRSEVQRVNGIVTQFLEFARPPRLHTERVDVAELLRDSIRVMDSRARAQGTAISVIAEANVHAQLDRNRMQQALLNVLSNALEALGEGGEIKCVLCRMHGRIALTVADTGPGIPEEQRSRIFNLYFTTKANGTGLGLSLVHQIVSEHDGEITVTSSPGAGATFRMLLPDSST